MCLHGSDTFQIIIQDILGFDTSTKDKFEVFYEPFVNSIINNESLNSTAKVKKAILIYLDSILEK